VFETIPVRGPMYLWAQPHRAQTMRVGHGMLNLISSSFGCRKVSKGPYTSIRILCVAIASSHFRSSSIASAEKMYKNSCQRKPMTPGSTRGPHTGQNLRTPLGPSLRYSPLPSLSTVSVCEVLLALQHAYELYREILVHYC
jgi:hypothetical protein